MNESYRMNERRHICLFPESIPAELKSRPQWVAWRYGKLRDNGKREKVPINPRTLTSADSSDPATWGTFEQALATAKKYEGVGSNFSADDSNCGVDIDGCRNPGTGEVHPAALEIVKQLGGYCEVSPSGEGFKTWVQATRLGTRCSTTDTPWGGKLEIYDRDRFFTVTGHVFRDGPITERQEAVDELYERFFPEPDEEATHAPAQYGLRVVSYPGTDTELLQAAFRNSKTGETVKNIYEGNWNGYKSQSEAEFKLCKELAEYDPDPNRIERLLLDSGLSRPRSESPKTRRHTIEKAITSSSGFYEVDYGEQKKQHVCALVEEWKKEIKDWKDRKYTNEALFILNYFKGGWMDEERTVSYSKGNREIARDSKNTSVEMSQSKVCRVFEWLRGHGVLKMDESYNNEQKAKRRSAAYRLACRESQVCITEEDSQVNHKYYAHWVKERNVVLEEQAASATREVNESAIHEERSRTGGEPPQTTPLTGAEIEGAWKANEDHPLTCECVTCSTPTPRHAKPYGEAGAVRLHEAA